MKRAKFGIDFVIIFLPRPKPTGCNHFTTPSSLKRKRFEMPVSRYPNYPVHIQHDFVRNEKESSACPPCPLQKKRTKHHGSPGCASIRW